MSNHYFLFTYSVSPTIKIEERIKAAEKARKKIAELELRNWEKLEHVETAFAGKLTLISNTNSGKKLEAKKKIKEVIKEVLDDLDVYRAVCVDVALSVNDLGSHMEFEV